MEGSVIYKIVNTVNGKFYVGSTTNTRERFRVHRNRLRNNKHHATHLQAAWNKYGEHAFVFHIVQVVPDGESLRAVEDVWLAEHVGKPYCYNKSRYSDTPMRGISKEQHPSFGRPKTEEERRAISKSLKAFYAEDITNHPRFGKKHTPETIAKIIANRTAPKGESHYRRGQLLPEETRKKIGNTQRGVPKTPRKYTEEGLRKAQETMRRNAREQKPIDFSEVLDKFPNEVKAKYDFSSAVYFGALVRIEKCMCPIHGEFSQYAAQFRKGRGCPSCGQVQRSATRSAQMQQAWSDPEERAKMMQARKKILDTP